MAGKGVDGKPTAATAAAATTTPDTTTTAAAAVTSKGKGKGKVDAKGNNKLGDEKAQACRDAGLCIGFQTGTCKYEKDLSLIHISEPTRPY